MTRMTRRVPSAMLVFVAATAGGERDHRLGAVVLSVPR
jgi:hypothetical protein